MKPPRRSCNEHTKYTHESDLDMPQEKLLNCRNSLGLMRCDSLSTFEFLSNVIIFKVRTHRFTAPKKKTTTTTKEITERIEKRTTHGERTLISLLKVFIEIVACNYSLTNAKMRESRDFVSRRGVRCSTDICSVTSERRFSLLASKSSSPFVLAVFVSCFNPPFFLLSRVRV